MDIEYNYTIGDMGQLKIEKYDMVTTEELSGNAEHYDQATMLLSVAVDILKAVVNNTSGINAHWLSDAIDGIELSQEAVDRLHLIERSKSQ